MGETKDKWWYIKKISEYSDRYGSLLVQLMEENDKHNLEVITLNEAKEFYEKYLQTD